MHLRCPASDQCEANSGGKPGHPDDVTPGGDAAKGMAPQSTTHSVDRLKAPAAVFPSLRTLLGNPWPDGQPAPASAFILRHVARMAYKTADIKTLLSDLGKATRRGIRKCPECGTINGTRGLSCKNRDCSHVFKEIPPERRRVHLEACRLVTEVPDRDVFSVRHRERGANEQRGFVTVQSLYSGDQIDQTDEAQPVTPFIASTSSQSHLTGTMTHATPDSYKFCCYVDSCRHYNCPVGLSARPQDDFWTADSFCCHTLACFQALTLSKSNSVKESQPLTVKHSILNGMSLPSDWKQVIWLRARRDGPLVQRVSSSAMVVKCEPDAKYPLGYLHTYFLAGGPSPDEVHRFACSCELSEPNGCAASSPKKRLHQPQLPSLTFHASNSTDVTRCIHFYSCIAVFSGDASMSREFSRFIIDDKVMSSMQQVIAILDQDVNGDIKVEVLDANLLSAEVGGVKRLDCTPEEALELQIGIDSKDRRSSLANKSSFLHELMHADGGQRKTRADFGLAYEAKATNFSAIEWLASVTERINQTMHYQFEGTPDPLVFHVPHLFFDFFRERFSPHYDKKRLPNSTVTFTKKDQPPLGSFTKYTWAITSVIEVKSIFDNPYVSLDITRNFDLNLDGSFSLALSPGNSSAKTGYRRRDEYKTFLKVGQMSSDPANVTPFIIEWIPEVLPRTKVGELRIIFHYGHQKNGQLDPDRSKLLAV